MHECPKQREEEEEEAEEEIVTQPPRGYNALPCPLYPAPWWILNEL